MDRPLSKLAPCTHPAAQGRGYARMLIARSSTEMLRAGETPFLHVESANTRAIKIYPRSVPSNAPSSPALRETNR
jgi:GNAT superfamily N-acetyltransferase